jgi:hypothetical protein
MGEHGEGRKSPRSSGAQESLAGRRKIKLSELLSELWSLPPPGSIPRLAIDNAVRSAGVDVPRAIVSTPAIQVHTHLLAKRTLSCNIARVGHPFQRQTYVRENVASSRVQFSVTKLIRYGISHSRLPYP